MRSRNRRRFAQGALSGLIIGVVVVGGDIARRIGTGVVLLYLAVLAGVVAVMTKGGRR